MGLPTVRADINRIAGKADGGGFQKAILKRDILDDLSSSLRTVGTTKKVKGLAIWVNLFFCDCAKFLLHLIQNLHSIPQTLRVVTGITADKVIDIRNPGIRSVPSVPVFPLEI